MAVIVAVIVRCEAAVAPGLCPVPGVTASELESTAFSPGFLRRSTTFS